MANIVLRSHRCARQALHIWNTSYAASVPTLSLCVCVYACVFFLFNMEWLDFMSAWVWIIYDVHVVLALTSLCGGKRSSKGPSV